jgi:hypothetical protein
MARVRGYCQVFGLLIYELGGEGPEPVKIDVKLSANPYAALIEALRTPDRRANEPILSRLAPLASRDGLMFGFMIVLLAGAGIVLKQLLPLAFVGSADATSGPITFQARR